MAQGPWIKLDIVTGQWERYLRTPPCMKIGIIGSGNIGAPLGRLWAAAGHRVMYASRHPERLKMLALKAGPNATVGSVDEAADFGDVILQAVPFKAATELPLDRLQGKVLLTTVNYYPQRDGEIDLGGLPESEWLAHKLPGIRLVKAFNMMEAAVMEGLADGNEDRLLTIFIASDDEDAKEVAAKLVEDARFAPLDVGSLRESLLFQTFGRFYAKQWSLDRAQKELDIAVSAGK